MIVTFLFLIYTLILAEGLYIPLKTTVSSFEPHSFDWRDKGAVSEVNEQGDCGSCFAFAVTGTIEGQIWKKTGKLVDLSEQQLIDCDRIIDRCNGSDMGQTFNYLIGAKGIALEEDYPYVSGSSGKPNETCLFKKEKSVASIKRWYQIPMDDEVKLKEALINIGPIAVSLSVNDDFDDYTSGIYYNNKSKDADLNHAGLLVGYGTDEATKVPYWIIKNSYGEEWGEKGYFRLERNINSCNVALYALYITLDLDMLNIK